MWSLDAHRRRVHACAALLKVTSTERAVGGSPAGWYDFRWRAAVLRDRLRPSLSGGRWLAAAAGPSDIQWRPQAGWCATAAVQWYEC
ncbi:unnamed protein product [Urochloa humidicola]